MRTIVVLANIWVVKVRHPRLALQGSRGERQRFTSGGNALHSTLQCPGQQATHARPC